MLSCDVIIWDDNTPFFIFPGNFTHYTCTIVSVNGTFVEDKIRGFKGECAHCSLNKCPIYTHDGARAKFSTNSLETDYSEVHNNFIILLYKNNEITTFLSSISGMFLVELQRA